MRNTLWFVALLGVSVAVAEEPQNGPQSGQAAATSGQAAGESREQAAPPARPLHRHPTLFSMLVRNNNLRRRAGLFAHRMNPALVAAAQDHANYMARTGQFSHYTNLGPQGRANKYGFGGGVRENIATGGNVDTAFSMWTASGAHYASIVSGTTDAGFGYAVGPNGATYFVGLYGSGSAGNSETEDQISQALKDEEAAKVVAAKPVTEETKTAADEDRAVKPASAEVDATQKPATQVTPAAAVESKPGN